MKWKVDCLLPSRSQYDVLHHFIRKLYEAFVRQGLICRLLGDEDRYAVPAEDPPHFTIGFNGALPGKRTGFACDELHIPHVSLLVDPPYHYTSLISSPYMIITCDDRSGCSMLKSWGFERTFFLPHAVEAELCTALEKEKVFDVALLATFFDIHKCKTEWMKVYPLELCKIMEESAETALTAPYSFIDVFQKLVQTSGKFANIHLGKVLSQVEKYLKGRDRILLAESISDAPLHIFGSALDLVGWKAYFGNRKSNVHVHGGITFESALNVMQQAKVVLNPSIKNKDGAHERFFTGTACGALVLTSESHYLREQFLEHQEIEYYRHGHPVAINSYLSDDHARTAVVKRARDKIAVFHTWDSRAKEIMEHVPALIEQIKMQAAS